MAWAGFALLVLVLAAVTAPLAELFITGVAPSDPLRPTPASPALSATARAQRPARRGAGECSSIAGYGVFLGAACGISYAVMARPSPPPPSRAAPPHTAPAT